MSRRGRVLLVAAVMLLLGLGSALAVYVTADPGPERDLVAEYRNSKRYAHELERYGGKATILADRFDQWFSGLWQGETLAYTVAFLTLLGSGAFLVVMLPAPESDPDNIDHQRNDPGQG